MTGGGWGYFVVIQKEGEVMSSGELFGVTVWRGRGVQFCQELR